ncbi:fibrobacter succinogenes major paralogous domain-containing protein [Fibrobacter sp.]|uniref:fibrobacter succinogenes major paralogous domain-containing protein n=1 Tax=Fibrobacter sp. TaxID=35828 RepID=UPI00386AFB6C
MKKIFVALCMVAFLAACDDSSSAFAGQNDEPGVESSSSVKQGSSNSSSSVDPISSSSLQGDKKSSSSGEKETSSSSVKSEFSSSAGEVDCSALLDGETKWNWDVPKECRFNSGIDYGTMTDSRDGKKYKTVTIGDQTWMAENLNYADSAKTPSLKGKSWCYNNEAKNCDVAGRLYTWAAAIDSVKLANDADNPQDCGYGKTCEVASAGSATLIQGICPSGWHLPSNEEWSALFTAVGGRATAGAKLKSQTGWTAIDGITNEDAYGFSALPAGIRDNIGFFYNGGNLAYFRSATEYNRYYAYFMFLNYDFELADLNYYYKYYGFSVRCLKD